MKPILFSTPMIRAILTGRKSMTRRVITGLPEGVYRIDTDNNITWGAYFGIWSDDYANHLMHATCCKEIKPKYLPGDVLWVRETFCLGKVECGENPDGSDGWYIEPDDDGGIIPKQWAESHDIGMDDVKWKPSIFMPKAFARIFLRVTGVRAEQLHDITEEDAIREGVMGLMDKIVYGLTGKTRFARLWDHLNKKRGYGWSTNPWVWVYEFERIERPSA